MHSHWLSMARDAATILLVVEALVLGLALLAAFYYANRGMRRLIAWAGEALARLRAQTTAWLASAEAAVRSVALQAIRLRSAMRGVWVGFRAVARAFARGR